MGASSYNRGTAIVVRDADTAIAHANKRATGAAIADEISRLKEHNERLQRELSRARRCIAELRRSKESVVADLRADLERSNAAIRILCRIAFPEDP